MESNGLNEDLLKPEFDEMDPEREAIQNEHIDAGEDGQAEQNPILILKKRRLVDMVANQPVPVIDGLATRKTTTLVSAAGGTGKTTLILQAAVEASIGVPIWGCADLQPRGSRWLYVNAEDALQGLDYWLGRILPKYDLQECPVDLFPVCETESGEFLLTPGNAVRLAQVINAGEYDGVIFDTGISMLVPGTKIIDPLAIRTWLRGSMGHIQRHTNAAIVVAVHDNKAGQAVSGTSDWLAFARLALHLESGGQDGENAVLTLKTIKANLRWPYQKFTLLRDPRSLTSNVASIERIEDSGGTPKTTEQVDELLAKLVRTDIISLPSEQRTTKATEARLFHLVREQGLSRQAVRDFISRRVRTESRKLGRTYANVVTGLHADGEGSQ